MSKYGPMFRALEREAEKITTYPPAGTGPITWEGILAAMRKIEDWHRKPRLSLMKMSTGTAQDILDSWAAPRYEISLPASMFVIPVCEDNTLPRGEVRFFDQYGDEMELS